MTVQSIPHDRDPRIIRFLQEVNDLTTKSRNFFVKMYLDSREENHDDIPLLVKAEIEELRKENRLLHQETCTQITKFKRSFANIFSHGKSEFDR